MPAFFFLTLPGAVKLQLVKSSALAILLGVLLLGLVHLGRGTRDELKQMERYGIDFSELEVVPPAGKTREAFLLDVQYLGEASYKQVLLDETLTERLAAIFAKHPSVKKVDKVEVTPPRRVQVKLTYRRGVLVVEDRGQRRVVDEEGVHLPRWTPSEELPSYPGKASPPSGPAGTRWGDPKVENVARKLAKL